MTPKMEAMHPIRLAEVKGASNFSLRENSSDGREYGTPSCRVCFGDWDT
jgi:hypothetical protein